MSRRILLLTPQLPWPLHQGTAIRNYHVTRWLAARHDVTLVTFGHPSGSDDPSHLAPLLALGVRVITAPAPGRRPLGRRFVDLWTTPIPDLARRLDAPSIRRALASLVDADAGGFDVVQIEGLEMAGHGLWLHELLARGAKRAPPGIQGGDGAIHPAVSSRASARPRLVYDAHNAEWVLQRRAFEADRFHPRTWPGAGYSWVQTAKLRRFERRLLETADVTIAVSEADAMALREVARPRQLYVIPNGVDPSAVRPAAPELVDPNLVVFIGKMDFRPNVDAMVWFVREVWPRVTARRPRTRLAIVGRDPTPKVRALATGSGPVAAGIHVTGAVPDVTPYLEQAGVVVVPLRVGGGTRLKVLEAMAAGKAIVATSMAVEGLDVAGGRQLILEDEPAALAQAIVELLASPERRLALGQAARRLVEERYAWDHLLGAVSGVYEDET